MVGRTKFSQIAEQGTTTPEMVAVLEKQHIKEPQVIKCPRCGSDQSWKYGTEHGQQVYLCQAYRHKFNARGAPYRMRVPTEQIGAAIGMWYDGLSLSKIARQLEQSFSTQINTYTV